MPFFEKRRSLISCALALLLLVAVTLIPFGLAEAREEFKVDISRPGSGARPLTANVSSFSNIPGAERGYLPGLMTRTPAVT
ncbi:MAG TPA: hypothetical protein PKD05_17905, partial [Candidatus Melainabacteria bacterium]|nr:hypothetical protein [Candidatus Melainabacteria bacterium]